MVLDSIDEKGQKWYSAKGEPSPVYIRVGTSHGKHFWKCLEEIEKVYKFEI